MPFLNASQTWGIIIASGTATTTGSIFISLLILMLVLMAIAMLFGIKLEFTALIILPLLLGYMAYYSEFVGVASVILIYLALMFAQKFLFK